MQFGPGTGVEKLCEELKRRSRQIDTLENALHLRNKELADAKGSSANLSKTLREKDAKLAELQSQNATLLKENKQRAEAADNLQQQLASSRGGACPAAQVPAARVGAPADSSAVAALKEELEAKDAKIAALKAAAAAAPKPVGGQAGGGSSWEASRVKGLQDEAATWKGRSEGLMNEVKSLQRQLGALTNEHAGLEQQCAALAEANTGLEQSLKEARSDLAYLRSVASQSSSELKTQLQRKDSDSVRLAAEYDRREAEAEALQAQIQQQSQMMSRLEQVVSNLEAQAAQLKADKVAREADVASLSAAADVQLQEINGLKAELKNTTAAKEALALQVDGLLQKLQAATQATSGSETELHRLAAVHQDALTRQDSLQQQVRNTIERAAAGELAAEDLKAQLVKMRVQLEAKDNQMAEVAALLEEKEQQVKALQAAVEEAGSGRARMDEAIARMQTRAEGMQEGLDAKATDVVKLAAEAAELRALAEERGKALEVATAQLKAADAAIAKVKAGAAEEVEELRKLVDAGVREREGMQAAIEALTVAVKVETQGNDQMDALLANLASLNAQVEDGHAALALANGQLVQLSDELAAAQALGQEKQLLLENLHEAVASKDRRMRELKSEAEEAAATIAELERQLEGQGDYLMATEDGKVAKDFEVSSLRTQARGQELELVDLRRALDAAQADLAATLQRCAAAEKDAREAWQSAAVAGAAVGMAKATPDKAPAMEQVPTESEPAPEDSFASAVEETDAAEVAQDAEAEAESKATPQLRINLPLAKGLDEMHIDSPSAAIAAVNAATPSGLRVSSYTLDLEASEEMDEEVEQKEEDEEEEKSVDAAPAAEEVTQEGEEAAEEELAAAEEVEETAEQEKAEPDFEVAEEAPSSLNKELSGKPPSRVVSMSASAGVMLAEPAA